MQLKQNLMMSCGRCGVGTGTATMAPCSRAKGGGPPLMQMTIDGASSVITKLKMSCSSHLI